MIAASKAEFEKACSGLPFLGGLNFSAEIVCIEPIDGAYFRNASRQRCIIRVNGRLFVANYD